MRAIVPFSDNRLANRVNLKATASNSNKKQIMQTVTFSFSTIYLAFETEL